MNKQPEQIKDPHELDILRAINRGEQKIADVDWQSYLSHLVVLIHLMKEFSPIGVVCIHTSDSHPHQSIYNVQGDLVQGNKHVDTQINHVASNAIGAQINKN